MIQEEGVTVDAVMHNDLLTIMKSMVNQKKMIVINSKIVFGSSS